MQYHHSSPKEHGQSFDVEESDMQQYPSICRCKKCVWFSEVGEGGRLGQGSHNCSAAVPPTHDQVTGLRNVVKLLEDIHCRGLLSRAIEVLFPMHSVGFVGIIVGNALSTILIFVA